MASLCEALGSSDCISIGLSRVKAFVAGYISVNSLCARVCLCVCLSVFLCHMSHGCSCGFGHVYVLQTLIEVF